MAKFIYFPSYYNNVHMSTDSIDEELSNLVRKHIATSKSKDAEIPEGSDDSPKSEIPKNYNKNNEFNEYETDDRDPLQDKSLDDREW